MYKIATILRNRQAPNIFRRTMLQAFAEGIGDEYLICSGFFQERTYKNSSYFASDSFRNNPPEFPCRVSVTTVGVYNAYSWGAQYDDFASALSKISCACGRLINVKQRKSKGRSKWHAKIFIVRDQGTPILAIVGSSNITKNAFDELQGWNKECDSIIWSDNSSKADSLVRVSASNSSDNDVVAGAPEEFDTQNNILVSTYDSEDQLNTRNDSMDIRLNDLWDQIIDSSIES